MKINEQNSLRVLLLAIALTILGGAAGLMFYATSQNEAVLASESELLAARSSCPKGQVWRNGKCMPIVIEPTAEEKCLADGKVWNSETGLCDEVQKTITCGEDENEVNGECKKKSEICEEGGGTWYEKIGEKGKCIDCEPGETIIDGVCVNEAKLACEKTDGFYNETTGDCEHTCSGGKTYIDGACVCPENTVDMSGQCVPKVEEEDPDKEQKECEAGGGKWVDGKCEPQEEKDENDLDGDGIPNYEDDDIDGDGYPNVDDLDAYHYNVGDRDILMFATLAYEPVSASMDKIAGDTITGNGKTVAENYYADAKNTSAPEDTWKTGYPDYFNYICENKASWNVAAEGRNRCMINEDQMIGMQAQDYNSEMGALIGAWETPNKDFYFGDDQNKDGGASDYADAYKKRGLDESAYKGFASLEEVNQWVVVNHTSQHIPFLDTNVPNLSREEGIMQATVFRMNNNFVIAYRGTDFPDIFDWFSDLAYTSNSIKGYEDAVQEYAREMVALYSQEYFNNPEEYIEKFGGEPNFYITGHSLGGYLAPIGALGIIESNVQGKEFLRDVVYFNGMGVGLFGNGSGVAVFNEQRDGEYNKLFDWAQETDENGALMHRVMCYNIYGDPVSALGRHVNQTGYYSAEGAIIYHSNQHVAALQSATRDKILESLLNVGLWGNPLAKALGDHGEMYNRLDTARDYMEYYSDLYGHMFESTLKTTGALSPFDIFFFCHEPSASLFYNISQGTRGYPEQARITTTHSKNTTTLTAEVNADVESYEWYRDGALLGTGNTYSFPSNELTNGTYKVVAVVKSRQSNKETVKKTISSEIRIDNSAPRIVINTEGGTKNPQSGETVNFIIRATDDSGFEDGVLSLDDIEISSSMLKKNLTVGTPELLGESSDTAKVWRVSVKSTSAGALRLIVKDGAFSDASKTESKKISSSIVNFTIFEHKQDDDIRPTVRIIPETNTTVEKGQNVNFRIEAFDEEGIEKVDLENRTTFVCTLGNAKINWTSPGVIYSEDKKTAYMNVSVSCDDSSKVVSFGTITVKSNAFTDKNGNGNILKTSASLTNQIRFNAPADKTPPFVKVASENGWKGTYGGSLTYTISVNDDNGISEESSLENNIEVLDIRNGISITNISGPTYNNDRTVANYKVTVSSNEHCSKHIGCGGTFRIKAGAFKDTYGNGSLVRYSGNIAFASERDIVAPTVQIVPENSRSAEVGESLNFKVIVKDAGGIDTDKVLAKDDFTIVGNGESNIYVENVTEPLYNDTYTQATYIVTVKGEGVSSNVQLNLKNGAIKDNAGNSSPSLLSDIIMFIKRQDLTPPKVTITPVTSWNAIKGNELNFVVTAKDDNKLSKNKSVTTSSFYMTKLIGNDVTVKEVSGPTYSEGDTKVSYTVTVYATKTGKASLSVKLGTFRDNSNNLSLLKLSDTITFEDTKDTTPPKISINYDPGTSVKRGNTIQMIVTVTDAGGLINPTLKKENITVVGNNNIVVDNVSLSYSTKTEAEWRVTVKCNGSFGFGQLVKDAKIVFPSGLFNDGANKSARTASNLIRFTKY